MRIVVIGAGVVGVALAEQLSNEGHQVAVVDQDRNKVRALTEKLDVLCVHGNACMPSVLERVGIRKADMVIAVTDVDEVNLVVGMLAGRLGVQHRIVRIRNPEYSARNSVLSLQDLGIDHVINPEPSIVDSLLKMIEIPGTTDIARIANGQITVLGFDIAEDSPAAGKSLAQLRELGDLNAFLVLYIARGEEVMVPKGNQVLQPGDNVHVLVASDMVQFLLPIFHRHPRATQHVILCGASRIGLELAKRLQGRVGRIVLIEANEHLAQEAAEQLRRVTVLLGDETDIDLLEEASVDRCDLFCALSDDDQRNMLSALLAKRHGAAKTAVLVHHPEYVPVMDSLGVEIVINPRLVTVGEILTHVRRGHIHSVTRLAESKAEIIELEAEAGSVAVGGPLRDIKWPEHALVGAVVQDGVMHIANGDTVIKPGESVVVYALPDAIARIEKIFSAAP